MVTRKELIETAASVIKSKKVKGGLIGDVGCALETVSGNVYTGVCADVGSNNFCAETIAIGSMITNKEFTIKRIVAVWKDKGSVYVIPPCGNCRQLMREINEENLEVTDVILGTKKTKLKKLLPYHDSWQKV